MAVIVTVAILLPDRSGLRDSRKCKARKAFSLQWPELRRLQACQAVWVLTRQSFSRLNRKQGPRRSAYWLRTDGLPLNRSPNAACTTHFVSAATPAPTNWRRNSPSYRKLLFADLMDRRRTPYRCLHRPPRTLGY